MNVKDCMHEQEHKAAVEQVKDAAFSMEHLEKVCNIFRVLGEPSRMKIVLALMKGELCVFHIVEACGGTQSAVSHQLRILKDNGIVKARRDGQNVLYSIADEHVREIVEMGVAHIACHQ